MAWLCATILTGFALLLIAAADVHTPPDSTKALACANCVSEHKPAHHKFSCPACMSPAELGALLAMLVDPRTTLPAAC